MSKHFNMTGLRSIVVVLVLACLGTWAIPVRAITEPDLAQPCSLTLTLQDADGNPAAGTQVALYRVGAPVNDGGDFSYQLTGSFTQASVDLATVTDGTAAESAATQLAQIAADRKLAGQTATADAAGKLSYDSLQTGMYLLVVTKQAEGFSVSSPFIVSLPQGSNQEGWTYQVDASPKTATTSTSTPDTPPDTPPENPPTESPKTPPTSPKLPQTGVNWWPVLILAFTGLVLLGLGWYRYRRSGHDK